MNRTAVIIGTGLHLPEKNITNQELLEKYKEKMGEEEYHHAEKMISTRGSLNRRKAIDPEETTAVMGANAAKKALENAKIKATDLDLIILATDTPDFITPATSARIQNEIGANDVGFFDINAACAGFTIALTTAWNFLRSDENMKYILVIGSYQMSRFVVPNNLESELSFSDGAGAIVLKAVENSPYGIKSATIRGKGEYWDYFGIYARGAWKGLSKEALDNNYQYLLMPKRFPKDINVQNWPPVILETLKKANWKKEEINHAFFTQAKLETIDLVCDVLGWPHSISYNIMDKYGYTGNACVVMALDEASREGVLKNGDKILICTSGTGTSYSTMALIWGK